MRLCLQLPKKYNVVFYADDTNPNAMTLLKD
jgi:hypothetical protein